MFPISSSYHTNTHLKASGQWYIYIYVRTYVYTYIYWWDRNQIKSIVREYQLPSQYIHIQVSLSQRRKKKSISTPCQKIILIFFRFNKYLKYRDAGQLYCYYFYCICGFWFGPDHGLGSFLLQSSWSLSNCLCNVIFTWSPQLSSDRSSIKSLWNHVQDSVWHNWQFKNWWIWAEK